MKKNNGGFFVIGIIIGGTMLLAALGFPRIADLSLAAPASTRTPALEPRARLIALEPTTVPHKATQTRVSPAAASRPTSTSLPQTGSPTPTPLRLPNGQRPEIIGYSTEGRPLEVYTFGDGEHERMIVAGIHGGDEWNTVTLANQLIEYLAQSPGLLPKDVRLYILPDLNPDGEARSHNKYGRLNHNGVDLNRNFPVNWKKDWDRSGCWNSLPTSGGEGPGSEVETQALMDFIGSHKIEALIGYHSAGLGVFPGGFPWDADASRLAQSIADVTSYPFPPIDTGCTYSGTLADYAVSHGAAAVDLELTNHIETDFEQNLQALAVLLDFIP